jgi:hypothetical protein
VITISGKWITEHPDDLGMVIHELVHVVQGYPNSRHKAGWLVEGIADYIRWWRYEPEAPRPRIDPAKSSTPTPTGRRATSSRGPRASTTCASCPPSTAPCGRRRTRCPFSPALRQGRGRALAGVHREQAVTPLTLELASSLAQLPLGCIAGSIRTSGPPAARRERRAESAGAASRVLLRVPRLALSVHGHWMLVRLLRRFSLPNEAAVRAKLDENLTRRTSWSRRSI